MIERLDVVEEPRKEWELRMEIAAAPRSGAVVATLRDAEVAARRLHPRPGRPCRSTGRTGSPSPAPTAPASPRCWRALLGRLPLDAGHATLGSGVVVGEVDQARGLFLGDGAAAGRVLRGRARHRTAPKSARCWPSSACKADHVLRPAATLSPGERTRAALALLQGRGVNLLVLDEPTNHLDLPAIEQLESALDSYDGHAAAGHPRPPDAGRGPGHPPLRGGGRQGDGS